MVRHVQRIFLRGARQGESCAVRKGEETWEESEHFSGETPAAMARLISCTEEQSKWRPMESKRRRMAAFGEDFIAKRAVSPNALGNLSTFSAWRRSPD